MQLGRLPQLTDPILVAGRLADRRRRPPAGSTVGRLLVVLPDGERRTFGTAAAEPAAEIHIHDRRALAKLLVDGETGGGEAYMDGLWSSPDLAGLLRLGGTQPRVPRVVGRLVPAPGAARVGRSPTGCGATRRRQSRRNISAHYDLATTSTGRSSTRR